MPWVPLKFPPGEARNATPYDNPGRWWDVNLVRWVGGALAPVGGCTKITFSAMSSAVRKLHQWRDNAGLAWIFVGMENGCGVIRDSFVDVSPANFVQFSEVGGGYGGYGAGSFGTDPGPASATVTFTNGTPGTVNWTTHGLSANDPVVFTTGTDEALHTNVTAGTVYYVKTVGGADSFTISAAPAGTAINFSGSAPSGTITGHKTKNATVTISAANPGEVTWTAHGFVGNEPVIFGTSGSLPAAMTAGTIYFVKTIVSADKFTISATQGGTAIDGGAGSTATTKASWHEAYGTGRTAANPAYVNILQHWSCSNWGQDLMAVASWDGRLLHFAATTGTPAAMDVPSNAPTSNAGVVVTAERSCMLIGARGTAFSDGGSSRRVAWSDFEDYNGWTFNSATNQAGYFDLEATSPLVACARIKEGVLVLSQHEVFLIRYVGPPYYYGSEKLGNTTFAAPYCLATAGNMAIWLGTECFWAYDGNVVRVVDCPNFSDFKQDLDPTYGWAHATMHSNDQFPEFWLDYPKTTSTDGENNAYLVYGYAENWWAGGARSRSAACGGLATAKPIAAGTDKIIYQHEDGWTDAGTSRIEQVYAETAVLDIPGDNNIDITRALVAEDPHLGLSNYEVYFYARQTPGGTERTFGPYTPRADGYVDCRVTGRDIRMRIENAQDSYWSIGQIRLNIETGRSGDR